MPAAPRLLASILLCALPGSGGCTLNLWRDPLGPQTDRIAVRLEHDAVAVHVDAEAEPPHLGFSFGPRSPDGRERHLLLEGGVDARLAACLLAGSASVDGETITVVELALADHDPRDPVVPRVIVTLHGASRPDGTPAAVVHTSEWTGRFVEGRVPSPCVPRRVRIATSVLRTRGQPFLVDVGMRLLLTPLTLALDVMTIGLLSYLQVDDDAVGLEHDPVTDSWYWGIGPAR
ncbi:MAG: hypothetical protein HZB39_10515 [Planctomycetes bacterium]|nr:hypothetical protein [Planctomycetota bacterium]